jgi:hypothetical protein
MHSVAGQLRSSSLPLTVIEAIIIQSGGEWHVREVAAHSPAYILLISPLPPGDTTPTALSHKVIDR